MLYASQDGRRELSTCYSFYSFSKANKRSLNTKNFSHCLSTFSATDRNAVAIQNAFLSIPHSLKSGYQLNNSIYHLRKLTFITIKRTKLFNNSLKISPTFSLYFHYSSTEESVKMRVPDSLANFFSPLPGMFNSCSDPEDYLRCWLLSFYFSGCGIKSFPSQDFCERSLSGWTCFDALQIPLILNKIPAISKATKTLHRWMNCFGFLGVLRSCVLVSF